MQKEIFLSSEGSLWYTRNKEYLKSDAIQQDKIVSYFFEKKHNPGNILEIGCANGWRLNEIKKALGEGNYYGIEPGLEAIYDGQKKFLEINLVQSTADNLPFEDNYFDNIIIGFCLYLCDRDDLFKIAYEVDRVLKKGGNIFIVDFDPGYIYANEYAHVSGLKSYKMDYSKLFLWNPIYTLIHKDLYSHTLAGDINDPNERISMQVIRKNITHVYPKSLFSNE